MSFFLGETREREGQTFATGEEYRGVVQTLGDGFRRTVAEAQRAGEGYSEADIERINAGQSRLFSASRRSFELVDSSAGRANAIADAFDNRIETVRRVTGVTLENPERNAYFKEAEDEYRLLRQQGTISAVDAVNGDNFASRRVSLQREIFNRKVDELAQAQPDKASALAFGQSIEDQAKAIAGAAAAELDNARRETGGGFVSEIAGALTGIARDPGNLAALFAGGGPGTAKTLLGRLAQVALREGAINAGVEAVQQPGVQAWRAELSLKNGIEPALENIGLAFLFGATIGGGVQGLGEAFGRGVSRASDQDRAAVQAVLRGEASADDVERAARAMGVELDETTQADLATLRAIEADDATVPAAPQGVSVADHNEALLDAVRAAENPDAPPPAPPIPAPPRNPDLPDLTDAAAVPGRAFDYLGKPVTFGSFDAAALRTDAATFQYKGNGDAAGVTDRLRSVGRWDDLASGKAMIFEARDGTLFIADGHQRLGLANRLLAEGRETSVKLDGFLFREADGWTPVDVRAIAAKKNIQEGSGDALDTARILRERPDLYDDSLPISDGRMQQALGLSKLSDDAWGAALNGVIEPNHAAWIGRLAPDRPELHGALVKALVDVRPESEAAARFVLRDAMAAGFRTDVQETMFGALEATVSLAPERAKVFAAASRELANDKRLFATLTDKAGAIEAAGNQLDTAANASRLDAAQKLSFLLEKLASRTGPISDALNRAAAAVGEGAQVGRAAKTFVADVMQAIERDGLAALETRPTLRPAETIEPGSPDALRVADALLPEPTPRDPDTADMFGMIPVALRADGRDMRALSVNDALKEAERPETLGDLLGGCKL